MPGRDGERSRAAWPGRGLAHAWYTPWLILAGSLAIVFGIYAGSLAWRDRDLSARADHCVDEAAETLHRFMDELEDKALALEDPADVARFVRVESGELLDFGATGMAVTTRDGGGAFSTAYASTSGSRYEGALAPDVAAPYAIALDRAAETGRPTLAADVPNPVFALVPGLMNANVVLLVVPHDAPGARSTRWTTVFVNPRFLARAIVGQVPDIARISLFDARPANGIEPIATDFHAYTGHEDEALGELGGEGAPAHERAEVAQATDVHGDPGAVQTARASVVDTTWFLRVRAYPMTEASAVGKARVLLLLAGIAVCLLLFSIAQLVRRSARRAQRAVREATQSLTRSEERFKTIVQDSSDLVVIVDQDLHLLYASPRLQTMFGYDPDELRVLDLDELLDPGDIENAWHTLGRLTHGEPSSELLSLRIRHQDGHWVDVEAVVSNQLDNPSVGGFVAHVRDVTERTRARAELAVAQERFSSAFEHAAIGMALTTLDGRILQSNPAFAAMLGFETSELVTRRMSEFTFPDDVAAGRVLVRALLAGEIDNIRVEHRYRRSDATTVWAAVSVSLVSDGEGSPRHLIVQAADVTSRKAIEQRLAHQAVHDPLTGLPNRTQFLDRLRQALERAAGTHRQIAVFFLDLDHFKVVNDSLGHAAGDRLLITIADRLRGMSRANGSVARFGGDEFTVLCEITDEVEAQAIAERIAAEIERPSHVGAQELFVTASIGMVLSGVDGTRDRRHAETLVRDADAAMYEAKRLGRARIERSQGRSERGSVDQLETGTLLHRALQRGEMRVHYQPQVELETGRVVGFEALVRWEHPTRGLLQPGAFVPLAEETGLIVPIGLWVLETACAQAVAWRDSAEHERVSISVNLSPRQLAEPSLPADVARILERTGLPGDALWLEITEYMLMVDAESARSALDALRALGVHLSVDDFGTGYSSLGYLKHFPVEALKIDHSFVAGLGADPGDSAIVTACVRLAHALGLEVVAEGVETIEQLHELRALGCEQAQGALFTMPNSAEALGDRPTADSYVIG
jgi:diguanylate cyclase (GGDEF)-like protein/PAS domain S-box-containing protein